MGQFLKDVAASTLGSVVAAAVVVLLLSFWSWISKGGLIHLLGGLTKQDFEDILQVSRKSEKSETKTLIEFVNKMNVPVAVFWINFDGEQEKFRTLEPGERYTQSTFVTHPWIVKTLPSNQRVGSIVGSDSEQTLEVKVRN